MIEDRTLYPGAYNRAVPNDRTRDVLRETPPTDPKVLQHFRAFLSSVRSQPYCLDCVSRMYEQPASAVWTCLHENGILGRYAECGNCGRSRQTFRYLGSPES